MRSLPILAALVVAGCFTLGRAPLPPEVADVVAHLERHNLVFTPYPTAYDHAFDRIDPTAHVVTYEVRATGHRTSPRTYTPPAIIDFYLFESAARAEAGRAGLRRIHDRGSLYSDDRLVIYVRGAAAGLGITLGRRFGVPVQL